MPTASDPLVAIALNLLNARLTTVTGAFHGVVADGFGAFKTAAIPFAGDPCAAGLLIATPPGQTTTCDVHPTPKGRDLLAGAVLQTIAGSCGAHDAKRCLKLGDD